MSGTQKEKLLQGRVTSERKLFHNETASGAQAPGTERLRVSDTRVKDGHGGSGGNLAAACLCRTPDALITHN